MSYPQSPQPYRPYQQPVMVVLPPTSGAAVASMIMGIIGLLGGWCVFGLPCVVAVVLGHIGLVATKGGRRSGHGMAIAGLVMGYLVVVPAALFSIMFVFAGVFGDSGP